MIELDLTHGVNAIPRFRQSYLPIVEKTKLLYSLWIVIHRKMPRVERFGLGVRIDNALLDLLTALRKATFAETKQKTLFLEIAITKVDDIRFLIQLLWENKLMSNGQFVSFGTNLETIGRNAGGWKKGILEKTSPPVGREEKRK